MSKIIATIDVTSKLINPKMKGRVIIIQLTILDIFNLTFLKNLNVNIIDKILFIEK